MPRKDLFFFGLLGVVFILVVNIPYLWAYLNAGNEYQFGGFLLNPIDGNSYLAKMYQGWLGAWKFSLPYAYEPGAGGYLFLFYIALGQFARLVNSSLLASFHLARILGSVILVLCLWNFFRQTTNNRRSLWLAFGLALFGSGMGWIAATFGLFTADFWVAEGYPFLSAYANPHFTFGIALMVWIIAPNYEFNRKVGEVYRLLPEISWFLSAVVLALILPFGAVIASLVLCGFGIWNYINMKSSLIHDKRAKNENIVNHTYSDSWLKLVFVVAGGFPIMGYQMWITNTNPELAAWNAQNITAAPALWDLLISYSPIIIFAIPGSYLVWKIRDTKSWILLVWAVIGIMLVYFPWNLQRRFLLGYLIPLSGLAAIGLDQLLDWNRRFGLVAVFLVVMLMIPTNLMIGLGGIQAVNSREPKVLLHKEELAAMNWIAANTPQDALVVASPQTGLYIPAYTGRRVLYGHPYETIDATRMERIVTDFFSGSRGIEEIPKSFAVNYIFYGPREKELGNIELTSGIELIYSTEQIKVFIVAGQD